MKQDLELKGSSDFNIVGEYNNLIKSGSGNVHGNVYCESIKVNGSGDVKGDVYCRTISISGSGDIVGKIVATGDVTKGGSGDIKGSVKGVKIEKSGSGDIKGSVIGEEIIKKGSGDIEGDIRARKIEKSGSGDIEGNVEGQSLYKRGSGDIEGDVTVKEDVTIEGSGDIKGYVKCGRFLKQGVTSVKGISAHEVISRGSLRVREGCEAEFIEIDGEIRVDELLNGEIIKINYNGRSNIKEIGGEDIRISKSIDDIDYDSVFMNFLSKFSKKYEVGFRADIIEGNNIYLEDVTVKKVVGHNVTIGTGCIIDCIEYSGELITDNSSSIKDIRKEG